MSFSHALLITQVEWRKLMSRTSARFSVFLSIFFGIGIPLVVALFRVVSYWIADSAMGSSGATVQMAPINTEEVVLGVMWPLSLFLPILIVTVSALVTAGEFRAKTLREDLLRPVPRTTIIAAKWSALTLWCGLLVFVPFAISSAFCIPAFGFGQFWLDLIFGYAALALAFVSIATISMAFAVVLRSIAGTMAGAFIYFVANVVLTFGMTVSRFIMPASIPKAAVEAIQDLVPYTPAKAYFFWYGASPSSPWAWEGLITTLLTIMFAFIVTERVFSRIDVP